LLPAKNLRRFSLVHISSHNALYFHKCTRNQSIHLIQSNLLFTTHAKKSLYAVHPSIHQIGWQKVSLSWNWISTEQTSSKYMWIIANRNFEHHSSNQRRKEAFLIKKRGHCKFYKVSNQLNKHGDHRTDVSDCFSHQHVLQM